MLTTVFVVGESSFLFLSAIYLFIGMLKAFGKRTHWNYLSQNLGILPMENRPWNFGEDKRSAQVLFANYGLGDYPRISWL